MRAGYTTKIFFKTAEDQEAFLRFTNEIRMKRASYDVELTSKFKKALLNCRMDSVVSLTEIGE